jgi:hypothetical protein
MKEKRKFSAVTFETKRRREKNESTKFSFEQDYIRIFVVGMEKREMKTVVKIVREFKRKQTNSFFSHHVQLRSSSRIYF